MLGMLWCVPAHRSSYDSGAGRQMMIFLVTKQLKYPL
jgi:hypothetical protein